MLGGLDRPSAGKLIVDGKELAKLNEKQLVDYKKTTVGFVWQNNARNLVPYLNAQQNVMLPMIFGDEKKKKEKALELLEIVGMAHKKNNRPGQMSGGEQQRVAIAIALANDPKLLLADEPTGSVDVKTGAFILDMFRELNRSRNLTVVIVTHDRALSKKVNRVVAIRDGKTSSEMLVKQDYVNRLDSVTLLDNAHDEFAVLDRAGRVQITKELQEQIGLTGNKVKIEVIDGKIVISVPEEETDRVEIRG